MQLLKKIHIGKFLLLVVLLSFSTTKAQHLISPPYFYYDGTTTIQGKMVTGLPNQYLTIDPTGKNLQFIDAVTATPFNLANSTTDAGNNKSLSIWRDGAIGIGTNNPQKLLHLFSSGSTTAFLESSNNSTGQTSIDFRTGPFGNVNTQEWRLIGQGTTNGRRFDIWNQTTNTNALSILPNNNTGIGTQNPTSRLEVNGAATNTRAFPAGLSTIIDFSQSNLAYSEASPGAFTLTNIKDGGTYTLAVQGTTAGTASFTASGFIFKSPNNGPTTNLRETIYTFIVMGTSVYVYMTAGIANL